MLLNCDVGEDSWESLGLQGDPTSPSQWKSVLNVHWKDWCWSWSSSTLATWCEELTHWKRPDAGKNWRQEEKGTEDEMVGWHHWLDGYEFEQAPGAGDGQGSLVCCNPWGVKDSDTTEQMKWTELNWTEFEHPAFFRMVDSFLCVWLRPSCFLRCLIIFSRKLDILINIMWQLQNLEKLFFPRVCCYCCCWLIVQWLSQDNSVKFLFFDICSHWKLWSVNLVVSKHLDKDFLKCLDPCFIASVSVFWMSVRAYIQYVLNFHIYIC